VTDTSLIQSLVRDAERAETALAAEYDALPCVGHDHEAPASRPPKVRRARKAAPVAAPSVAAPGVLATREDQIRYVLAGYTDAGGNAHGGRFTLVSRASGVRYTYRVKPPTAGKAGAACRKCVGGYWQGRRNYPCFTCKGTGVTGAAPEGGSERLFVAVLTGSDNTSDYTYLGQIIRQPHPRYEHGRKSKIGPDAPSAKAAQWYLARLFGGGDLAPVEVWHDGTCARCGRDLTDPLSVSRGIGPECWAKMGL
jgi:hypothetical protein